MSRSVASAVTPASPASPASPVAAAVAMPHVVGACPQFLAAAIRREVRARRSWQDTADAVAAVLRHHLPGPGLLTPGQLAGDPAGYQTHLIHAEPDGSFSVAVMVWLPGQRTPVHDHLTWCVTAVLQGAEYEEIFAVRDGYLEVVARNQNPVGAVSGFAPPGDIHQVRNSGPGIAVSMHVYGTDITRVGSSIRREYDLPVR
ncbi:MAG TPA: cysteine dioxygenase family protein [Trebonia sp.]|nr:cysteine dioxygenase family protein [Trebonia sp.]